MPDQDEEKTFKYRPPIEDDDLKWIEGRSMRATTWFWIAVAGFFGVIYVMMPARCVGLC